MERLIEEAELISAKIKANEYQEAMAWEAFLAADDSQNAAYEKDLDRLDRRLKYLEYAQKQILARIALCAAETGLEHALQALAISP